MSTDPFEKYHPSPYFVGEQSEVQSLRNIDGRIRGVSAKKPRRLLWQWLAVAAAALLLLFVNQFVLKEEPGHAQLAARFFEPYPNYQTIVSRGTSDEGRLKEAYEFYDQGKYSESVFAFESATDRSAIDDFYYAVALQGLERWQESSETLNSIKSELPQEYHAAGDWHHALALVATNRVEDAKPLLEELASGRSSFVREAEDLLKAIR